jgi:hypothetical protein
VFFRRGCASPVEAEPQPKNRIQGRRRKGEAFPQGRAAKPLAGQGAMMAALGHEIAFTFLRPHNQLNMYQFDTLLSSANGSSILLRGNVQIRITTIPAQRLSVLAVLSGHWCRRPLGTEEV